MIGFFGREDLPRMAVSLVVGFVLLAVVGSTLQHYRMGAFLLLPAMVGIFFFSIWAGKAFWKWLSRG